MNKLVKSKKEKKGVKVIRYFFGRDNISFEKTYSYVWRCDGAERVWGWNYIGNITHILPPYIPKFFLLYSNNATNYRDAMKLGRQKMMTHKMYLRVDRQSCAISQKWHAHIHTTEEIKPEWDLLTFSPIFSKVKIYGWNFISFYFPKTFCFLKINLCLNLFWCMLQL